MVLTKLRVNLGLTIATMVEYHHDSAAFPTPPQNDNSECVFRNQKRASESRHTHREKARWDWLKPVPTP